MDKLESIVQIPSVTNMIPSVLEDSPRSLEDAMSRICPLCQSEVRLFFINFNYKMLMCENTECDFPFGYEDLQFVKEDGGALTHNDFDNASIISHSRTQTPSCSVVSHSAWSEIERINRAYDSEDSQPFEQKALDPTEFIASLQINVEPKQDKKKMDLKKNLEKLKELNLKMRPRNQRRRITNKNFVKEIINLKGERTLLKPEEAGLFIKAPNEADPKVEFQITTAEGSMPVIKVDLAGTNKPDPV
ncbi:uncharacterized protein LOC105385147 [Plutella xylostella]|uniref:uncharacterized protein LOC105385147 n=1 Tax=Plutella xylostella TaxID=51655 RepID=UPI0020323D96|nr:uncharacterized protein LOC105385147 [Plutella xylostella]